MPAGSDTGRWGAREISYSGFDGGLVLDVDPAQIGPSQCAAAVNVDLEARTIAKRKGRTKYNTTPFTADAVVGLGAYYPSAGGRLLLAAARSGGNLVLYGDLNSDGDFADAGETLLTVAPSTGPESLDFAQYRENLYLNPNHAGLYRWRGSGLPVLVQNLTAPAAPTLSLQRVTLEDFNAGGWTSTHADLTAAIVTYPDGTQITKVTAASASAESQYLHKAWSSGATVDLSAAEMVKVQVFCASAGVTFQVGIKDNSGTLNWDRHPWRQITASEAGQWLQVEVPLSGIPPADRSASTGLAIRWIGKASTAAYPLDLYFENAKAVGPQDTDTYRYYATYYSSGTRQESNASPAAVITIDQTQLWAAGVNVGLTATAQTDWAGATVDKIRVYRYRDNGTARAAVLVAECANATATCLDTKSDGQLAVDLAPELVPVRTDPPAAGCAAVVNQRLLLGDVLDGGTRRPYRLYLSRLGYPEEFTTLNPPTDGSMGGWIDIPTRDTIRRIVEYDSLAVIFCDRSIWSLTGDSWTNFSLQKRADVGLSARGAVTADDRLLYFLAPDGVRALLPNSGNLGVWSTWILSEPVGSLLRAIPKAYRGRAVLGLDERRRLHVAFTPAGGTANTVALVFNPQADGALAMALNPQRPGWTYYTAWPAGAFLTLRRGGTDNGELLAGDSAAGTVWTLHQGETDDGAAVAWSWTGRAERSETGGRLEWVYAEAECSAAAGQTLTASAILDRGAVQKNLTLDLGTAASGAVYPQGRFPPSARGHWGQLQVSGSHSVPLALHAVRFGYWPRP